MMSIELTSATLIDAPSIDDLFGCFFYSLPMRVKIHRMIEFDVHITGLTQVGDRNSWLWEGSSDESLDTGPTTYGTIKFDPCKNTVEGTMRSGQLEAPEVYMGTSHTILNGPDLSTIYAALRSHGAPVFTLNNGATPTLLVNSSRLHGKALILYCQSTGLTSLLCRCIYNPKTRQGSLEWHRHA